MEIEDAITRNPQQGQVWEHVDGGSLYVRSRSGPLVKVQRRPPGDSQAIPSWIKLKTFSKQTTGRLTITISVNLSLAGQAREVPRDGKP